MGAGGGTGLGCTVGGRERLGGWGIGRGTDCLGLGRGGGGGGIFNNAGTGGPMPAVSTVTPLTPALG